MRDRDGVSKHMIFVRRTRMQAVLPSFELRFQSKIPIRRDYSDLESGQQAASGR